MSNISWEVFKVIDTESKVKMLSEDWDWHWSNALQGNAFNKYLLHAIQKADSFNLVKLHSVYPIAVEMWVAKSQGKSWQDFISAYPKLEVE